MGNYTFQQITFASSLAGLWQFVLVYASIFPLSYTTDLLLDDLTHP